MRCPKCSTETPPGALRCPECKLQTPKAKIQAQARLEEKEEREEKQQAKRMKSRRASRRRRKRGEARRVGPFLTTVASILTVLTCGVGMYVVLTLSASSKPPAPGSAEYVIQTLGALPSKASGLTVEQCLESEVKKSREEGRLTEREGWDVRPDGEMTFRVAYTFQEKYSKKRAEWLFDVGQNIFIPQTDLAEQVYGAKQ